MDRSQPVTSEPRTRPRPLNASAHGRKAALVMMGILAIGFATLEATAEDRREPLTTSAGLRLQPTIDPNEPALARRLPPNLLFLYGEPGTNEGTFQDLAGQPDWQGWTSVDRRATLLPDNHWHVYDPGLTPPSFPLSHPVSSVEYGRSLTTVDSLAGDGRRAVVVGDISSISGGGRTHVYFGDDIDLGSPTWTLWHSSGDFGYSIADMGDIDGDGDHELLVGSPADTAFAYLGEPSVGLDTTAPDLVFVVPPGAVANFGRNVAGIGDFNDDGYDDWVIAAGKQLYLYFGGSVPDTTHDLEMGFSHIFATGWAITGGDVTGDGISDLIISTPGGIVNGLTSGFTGMVAVYPGSTSPTLSGATTFSDGDVDGGFGASLAVVEPVTGSAAKDLIIGEPWGNGGTGRIYRYTGGGPTPTWAETWTGSYPNGNLGHSVARMPELISAGTTAFVAGEPGGTTKGRAWVYLTGAVNESTSFVGPTAGARYGTRVANASEPATRGNAFIAVGPDAGGGEATLQRLDSSLMLYCGDQSPPPEWVNGAGYGDNWNDAIAWYGAVADPGSSTEVCLQAFLRVEIEEAYDFLIIEYETTSGFQNLGSLDGTVEPATMSWCANYAPGDYVIDPYTGLPSVHLRFRIQSDLGWSDEWGGVDTVLGAALLGDITVEMDGVSASRATLTPDASDDSPDGRGFPGFDSGGWFKEDLLVGDFTKLVSNFSDIDPIRENLTPQVSFIDDGTPPTNDPSARSTGGQLGTSTYGVPGNWVVNRDGGLSGGLLNLRNEIWSPEIIWDDTSRTTDDDYDYAVLSFDVWVDLPLANGMFFVWSVRHFDGTSWSPWHGDNSMHHGLFGPQYETRQFSIGDYVPVNAEKVQVSIGVEDGASLFGLPGLDSTPSPTFDNIRVFKQFDSVSEAATPVGVAVPVDLDEVQLEFDAVGTAGTTTVLQEVTYGNPANFYLATDPRILYQITTTAAFTDSIMVCITYDEADLTIPEDDMRLIHLEEGRWTDITRSHDLVTNTICGMSGGLSPFALALEVSPTDAPPDRAPTRTLLHAPRPNPFNPRTLIEYELESPGHVDLVIYDLRGRLVRRLANGPHEARAYSTVWDGKDGAGRSVASGVYVVRLETPTGQHQRKVSLIR